MAVETYIHGRVAYIPDKIIINRMLIDPKASPKDEIWRFLKACVSVWLNKSRVWSYSEDDIRDLESACLVLSYRNLLKLVREGKYNRKVSFYLNCRGCAWSAVSNCLSAYFTQARRNKKICSTDVEIEEGIPLISSISVANTFLTDTDDYANRERPLSSYKYAKSREIEAQKRLYDSWLRVVEDCEEMGLEGPESFEKWVLNNKD